MFSRINHYFRKNQPVLKSPMLKKQLLYLIPLVLIAFAFGCGKGGDGGGDYAPLSPTNNTTFTIKGNVVLPDNTSATITTNILASVNLASLTARLINRNDLDVVPAVSLSSTGEYIFSNVPAGEKYRILVVTPSNKIILQKFFDRIDANITGGSDGQIDHVSTVIAYLVKESGYTRKAIDIKKAIDEGKANIASFTESVINWLTGKFSTQHSDVTIFIRETFGSQKTQEIINIIPATSAPTVSPVDGTSTGSSTIGTDTIISGGETGTGSSSEPSGGGFDPYFLTFTPTPGLLLYDSENPNMWFVRYWLKIEFPKGMTIDNTTFKITGNIEEPIFEGRVFLKDGNYYGHVAFRSASETPALATLINNHGNVVFMKMIFWQDNNEPAIMDAFSTAEAMILFDPVFLKQGKETLAKARAKVLAHPEFSSLVAEVAHAVTQNYVEPISDAIIQKAFNISKSVAEELKILNDFKMAIKSAIGEPDKSKYVYVEDDPDRNKLSVFLTNRTFTHYTVTAYRNHSLIYNKMGMGFFRLPSADLIGSIFSWPPEVKEQVEIKDAGFGKLEFIFTKNSLLTGADAIFSLVSSVMGIPGADEEDLESLASLAGRAADFIQTIITTPINSTEDAKNLVKNVILNKNNLYLLVDIMDKVFGDRLKEKISQSWFSFLSGFAFKKLLLWGNFAIDVAQAATKLYSLAKSPDSYIEKGYQTQDGFYGDLFPMYLPKTNKLTFTAYIYGRWTATLYDSVKATTWNQNIGPSFGKITLYFDSLEWTQINSETLQANVGNNGTIKINIASEAITNIQLTTADMTFTFDKPIQFYWFGYAGFDGNYNRAIDQDTLIFRISQDKQIKPGLTTFSYAGSPLDSKKNVSVIDYRAPGGNVVTSKFILDELIFDDKGAYSSYIDLSFYRGN